MSAKIMPEKQALELHLHFRQAQLSEIQYFSSFVAALRDARLATNRNVDTGEKLPEQSHGSWLGAIGYVALLDQIGKCFKPKDDTKGKPDRGDNPIARALHRFTSLPDDEIGALCALRCAFAHDYSLYNINPGKPKLTHRFRVSARSTPVVRLPKVRWDGDYAKCTPDNETNIGLEAFGDLVEGVCRKILDLPAGEQLKIVLKGGSDELVNRYAYCILPPPMTRNGHGRRRVAQGCRRVHSAIPRSASVSGLRRSSGLALVMAGASHARAGRHSRSAAARTAYGRR